MQSARVLDVEWLLVTQLQRWLDYDAEQSNIKALGLLQDRSDHHYNADNRGPQPRCRTFAP